MYCKLSSTESKEEEISPRPEERLFSQSCCDVSVPTVEGPEVSLVGVKLIRKDPPTVRIFCVVSTLKVGLNAETFVNVIA